MNNRVCCLYRVSTDRQVDYDEKNNADIPMQRKECHRFAAEKGWTIVMEEQEEGISGHKVRAERRDKIQVIKAAALEKKFDILLVFMFDRIGRISDETPFVVEWFVKNGIRVWSTQEGEQRFDSHADRLMNYIRFWQADGESEKTSIRTKTALGQLAEEGHFTGGNAPYGYRLVESSRVNKRKHRVYELEIVESEAAVVRIMYEKYVYEGYGPQRISTYLNNQGYRNRSGKCWHPATINSILKNPTYIGILRCGESRSKVLPHLIIIPADLFNAAQSIRAARNKNAPFHVPQNTSGRSLLVGNVFCADCGSRLVPTTNKRKTATGKEYVRLRYVCYGKNRRQTECHGQTGYLMEKIDHAVDLLIKQIFEQMTGVSKQELIEVRYNQRVMELKTLTQVAHSDYQKAENDLATLKAEIPKAIRGESPFTTELLSDMIADGEKNCVRLREHWQTRQKSYEQAHQIHMELELQLNRMISMAEIYSDATMGTKKMILSQMVERVEVSRGYRIKMTFRQEFKKFFDYLEEPKEISA